MLPTNEAKKLKGIANDGYEEIYPLSKALKVSMAIHAFFFMAIIMGDDLFTFAPKKPDVIETEIVWDADLKFSTPKSKSSPTKQAPPPKKVEVPPPPPAKKVQETVKIESKKPKKASPKKSEAEAEPKKTPEPKKTVVDQQDDKRKKAMLSALEGLEGGDNKADAQDGIDPNSVSTSVQELIFKTQMKKRAQDHLYVTDNTWFTKYRNRVVEVAFNLDGEGNVINLKVKRSSGVASMDANLLEAVKKAAPFVAPTSELQSWALKQDFVIRFSPAKQDLY